MIDLEPGQDVAVGIDPECEECEDISPVDRYDIAREACESGGDRLLGNRYPGHSTWPGTKRPRVHICLCEDCMIAYVYGKDDEAS